MKEKQDGSHFQLKNKQTKTTRNLEKRVKQNECVQPHSRTGKTIANFQLFVLNSHGFELYYSEVTFKEY